MFLFFGVSLADLLHFRPQRISFDAPNSSVTKHHCEEFSKESVEDINS